MNKLKELKNRIKNIVINYNYEEVYNDIYNNVIDYMNETQDFNLEYIFDDYINYDIAEEYAKHELENNGLERLSYFLGNTKFYMENIFKIDGYGNLQNIHKDDLEQLKEELLERIDNLINETINS